MQFLYAVSVRPGTATGYVARCRDLPDLEIEAPTALAALAQAEDVIESDLRYRMRSGQEIPLPSPVSGSEAAVPVRARLAIKLAVYLAWRRAGISKTALARRMGRSEGEVRRILDPDHGTRLDQMDEAAQALGVRLTVGLRDAF